MRLHQITPDGVVFTVADARTAIALYEQFESRLQALADEWGEVAIVWEGCNCGFRKFARDLKRLLAVNSLASVDNLPMNEKSFDKVLTIQKVFGTALTGLNIPLIRTLEKMVTSEKLLSDGSYSMQFSKQVTIYRCDICGNDIPWTGNEMYEDAKKRDSGLLHDWCNDCYSRELMKATIENRAIALGTTPQKLLGKMLAHYDEEAIEQE